MVEGGSIPALCAVRLTGTVSRELTLTFSPISGGNATCKYITGDILHLLVCDICVTN